MQMTLFYNTTNESGSTLEKSYENAKNQDELILELFKKHGRLTPSKVYKILNEKYPITSIRRSINTLTKRYLIHKTYEMDIGMYGKHEHIWSI